MSTVRACEAENATRSSGSRTRGELAIAQCALCARFAHLYVRLFIIEHDCGHGSYFASARRV